MVAFNLIGIRATAFIKTSSLALIVADVLILCVMRDSNSHAGVLLWTRLDCLEELRKPQRTIKLLYVLGAMGTINSAAESAASSVFSLRAARRPSAL